MDTNIIIELFADDTTVKNRIRSSQEIFIPSIVIGELYFGARKSQRVTENLSRIDDFVANNVILVCDSETARHYGEIKNLLKIKGRPIPENDIWIGATAIQYSLILVTYDSHFREIDKLKIENWKES